MANPRFKTLLACLFAICFSCNTAAHAAPPDFLRSAERIVFLGDSITHAGHYISLLEAELRLRYPGRAPELINLGLPSETCSGLSEPDHPFPRPDVHERLQRALDKTKPDVVIACYGMNDGIYYPLDPRRFAPFQDGVKRLIDRVQASGAHLILMTPPAFDPLPLRKEGKLKPLGEEKYAWFAIYEDYDSVMARYAQWILQQRDRVDLAIDLHSPVNAYLKEKRTTNPDFTLSNDGVHINEEGHRILAAAILSACGLDEQLQSSQDLLQLVKQRQRLLHNAWLTHVGHQRPDMQPGLPLEEAQDQAKELEKQIRNAIK